MKKVLLLLSVSLFSLFLFSQEETKNYLSAEKQEGKAIRLIGDYHFVFSISKDWKVLHLDVQNNKGEPVAIDDLEIEVLVRPGNRRSPFKVVMKNYPIKQEGGQVTSHYAADLNFVENFKTFKANTFVTIKESRCVSEYHFSRE